MSTQQSPPPTKKKYKSWTTRLDQDDLGKAKELGSFLYQNHIIDSEKPYTIIKYALLWAHKQMKSLV